MKGNDKHESNSDGSRYADSSVDDLRDLYLNATAEVLPQLAAENSWVIRFDHCFQRVVLDNVFDDVWYNHLDKSSSKPAYKQLSHDQLVSALNLCREMEKMGSKKVEELNRKSLKFRGKLSE
ncbi:MAG: hypothetical protein J07AB43_15390 [Candidatus Nanosalina sp. J07AB43]|nr:MAG: hypothetical protein J07AB43_15390 [Candidatus Nanosalina sp. J07AB43]